MDAARPRHRHARRVLHTVVHRRRRSDHVVPSRADAPRAPVRGAPAHAPAPPRVPRSHCSRARRHLRRRSVPRGGCAPWVARSGGAPRHRRGTRRGGRVGAPGADRRSQGGGGVRRGVARGRAVRVEGAVWRGGTGDPAGVRWWWSSEGGMSLRVERYRHLFHS